MKTITISIILLIQSFISIGQTRQLTDEEYNNSGASNLIFVTDSEKAQKLAQTDIDKGMPFLFLQSGIAYTVYTTDSVFENQFNVFYYEQGCIGASHEMTKAYNQVIFEHLDKSYGKKWRKYVRKDVIGFKN